VVDVVCPGEAGDLIFEDVEGGSAAVEEVDLIPFGEEDA
jgi:hypothetical protein